MWRMHRRNMTSRARPRCSPATSEVSTATERCRLLFRKSGGNDFADRGAGKFVGPLVLWMPGVAFDPAPVDVVPRPRLLEPLPEVGILYGLPVGRAPAVPLPAVDPTGDPVPEIRAVGKQLHHRRSLQCFERPYGGH